MIKNYELLKWLWFIITVTACYRFSGAVRQPKLKTPLHFSSGTLHIWAFLLNFYLLSITLLSPEAEWKNATAHPLPPPWWTGASKNEQN